MKNLTLLVVYLLFSFISSSQDIIYLRNGTEIKAEITEIGVNEIKYKKFNFQDGPDYVVLKKATKYIVYENGKKDVFFKNLSGVQYKMLCERKVKHYYKQQKFGIGMAGAGLAGAILIGVNNYNYNMNHPNDYDRQILYDFSYAMCLGTIVGGTVLYLTGKHKVKQYSEKLGKLSFGFNYSDKMKGITLVYKF
ncbi:MAG: hypothetical protein GXO80_12855 [Chlorobi bacterium]|nr:hypothetical protein [Chlorobiota bacterium]